MTHCFSRVRENALPRTESSVFAYLPAIVDVQAETREPCHLRKRVERDMTRPQETMLAPATTIDTQLDNIQILNWGDYTRWCLYGNPGSISAGSNVNITTAKPGDYTDHFTTWSIVPDGAGYVEIKHDHTGGYATANSPSAGLTANYVTLKQRTGNIDQKWHMQYSESDNGAHVTVNPKINENLSAAAALQFSPAAWGYLVLRTRARNEWPSYLFVLDSPEQWQNG